LRKPPRLAVPDFGNIIAVAMAGGASAAIYSPLAGGFLTDAFLTGAARHPLARRIDASAAQTQVAAARVANLAFVPDEGETLAQAACRFVLANPGVATVLGGFSALEQMEEIVAVSGRGPIAPDKMRRIETLWDSNFAA
jgi:aryl-alcohol dehydrogenase-like predicted oxidoreductase